MPPTWNRDATITRLRPRLWRYLSSAAEAGRAPGAVPPLSLERRDFVRLFATHLALRTETDAALKAATHLLVELPSTSVTVREEAPGVVRGRVDWQRTALRRIATADPTLFVSSPPERRYDTPLGRLIRLSLWCVAQLHQLSGLPPSGTVGRAVAETSERARRLLLHPKLTKVRGTEPSSLRYTDEIVARRPVARWLVELVHDFWAGAVEGDVTALRALLERQYLAPSEDWRLFELQVGFDILDALERAGGVVASPYPLLPTTRVPFAQLHGSFGTCTVWWHRPAWVLDANLQQQGQWWRTLDDNRMRQQPLQPDFVVELPEFGRRLLVEVKLTAHEDDTAERDGLRDMLAYLSDAHPLFKSQPPPHGLVVAWNATGQFVRGDGRIAVSDQDYVRSSVSAVLLPGAPPRSRE